MKCVGSSDYETWKNTGRNKGTELEAQVWMVWSGGEGWEGRPIS